MEKNGVQELLKGLNCDMRMLITGGTGFVGYNLIQKLKEQGHEIFAFDDFSIATNKVEGIEYQRYDVYQDFQSWKWEYEDIDVIFHLAGLARIQPSFSSPLEYIDVNINGTAKICEIAKAHNAKLIYSSSSSINNGEYKTPYTFSKWGGEEALKT